MAGQIIHPSFRPVRQVTPEQAFHLVQQDLKRLGQLVNGLTDGLAQLYERFYALEKHLGISVVEQPPPTQEPESKVAAIEIVGS